MKNSSSICTPVESPRVTSAVRSCGVRAVGVTALGSLLALIAPATVAHAQSTPQRSAVPLGEPYAQSVASAQPVARGGGEAPGIDETFTRPVGEGCTYITHVEGRVATRAGGSSYAPDVRVNAALDCPDGVTRIRERAVHSDAMSAPELARTLGDAASVVRYSHGRDCTFAPSFAVEGAHVTGRAVNQACDARAKGPGETASAPVDERFARDLDNGCEYRAAVRGTMHTQGGAYAPDLRVQASVHCANVDAIDAPERSVRAQATSVAAVTQRVDRAGTVTTRQGDLQCTYAPSFSVEAGGDVAGQNVTYTCRGLHGEPATRGGVYVPRADARDTE